MRRNLEAGGRQTKIHYAQQARSKKPGSHSGSIRIDEFLEFYKGLSQVPLDIMLEVKDKNLSAVKCINCTSINGKIGDLEDEWSRYKYIVLERLPENYIKIRKLLKDKSAYPAVAFYRLIDEALEKNTVPGRCG